MQVQHQPILSIITPVRNAGIYILACLENVTAQGCPDVEHIIVDAVSTDGTMDIVREYAAAHPHVRFISEPDHGQADAMNKGIRMARGRIIGCLNADDWYEPGAVASALSHIAHLPEPAFVAGNCRLWDNAGREMEPNRPRSLGMTDLLLGVEHCPFPFNPSAYFYHRALHDHVGLYSLSEAEPFDVEFVFRAIGRAHVVYVDETWGNFRYRDGAKTYSDIRLGQDIRKLNALFSRMEAGLSSPQRRELFGKRRALRRNSVAPALIPARPAATPISFCVVVTSYNYCQYVCDAIESALKQQYPPAQVVIVDDGSTDGSAEMLRQRYGQHPRVQLLLEKNQGQLSAFCKGAQACTADAICFLDADDHWDSDYLEQLASAYALHPEVEFVHTNLKFVGKKQGTYFHDFTDRDQGYSMLLTYHTMAWIGSPTSAISMRSSLCRRILDLPAEIFVDWRVRADDVLVFGASLFGARKRYLGEARVNYCVHDANHWFNVPENEAGVFRRSWAIKRLFLHWAQHSTAYSDYFPYPAMAALTECHSRPELTWDEACMYAGAARNVRARDWSPMMRWRQILSIWRHYLRLKCTQRTKKR